MLDSKQFLGDKSPNLGAFQVTFFTQLAYHRMSDGLGTLASIPAQTGPSIYGRSLTFGDIPH